MRKEVEKVFVVCGLGLKKMESGKWKVESGKLFDVCGLGLKKVEGVRGLGLKKVGSCLTFRV